MQKIVILGATSEMIQPLLRTLAKAGKELLLVARSEKRLEALATDLMARGSPQVITLQADFDDAEQVVLDFAKKYFPDFDTLFLAYGTLRDQTACQIDAALAVRELKTNFLSPVALLTLFAPYFEERRSGTIAVITSVAGDRGRSSNYVYGSAKGGLSLFLEGLRSRMHKLGVRVLTIKPGPVATAMTENLFKGPPRARPETVSNDIYRALEDPGRDVVYTPRRWRWIMMVVRLIPEVLFKRLTF